MAKCDFTPRLLRIDQACHYLGVNKNFLRSQVRPHVTEIRVGTKGILLDRLELDGWIEQYVKCNGQPSSIGDDRCSEKSPQASSIVAVSGTYKNVSGGKADLERVLEKVTSRKRRHT
jgi:hypothetical protein